MNYQLRREKLIESMADDSLLLVFSGEAPLRSADETYPFCVDRNFFYLTGIERENMVLLLQKINGVSMEVLFLEPYDEALARWVGGRMKAEEAESISGVKTIKNVGDLDSYIANLYARNFRAKDLHVYLDLWRQRFNQQYAPGIAYSKRLLKRYPQIEILDSFPLTTQLRLVKDEDEIAEMKKAIEITRRGIEAMMDNIKPGVNESLMEAVFDFTLRHFGCKENAFETIAAAGERATVLHYHDNDQTCEDGQLFLADLGATSNNYCADISRTFPVNGKFTDRQKELYEMVLEVQQKVQDAAKPGVKLKELQQIVLDYYEEELPKHGLDKGVSEYYFHGVGHHLGLDTHDMDGGLGATLEVGNVITNEPGIYIRDEGIGIRIEDDLLISEDGCINLSEKIIKSVEDIEKLMA